MLFISPSETSAVNKFALEMISARNLSDEAGKIRIRFSLERESLEEKIGSVTDVFTWI